MGPGKEPGEYWKTVKRRFIAAAVFLMLVMPVLVAFAPPNQEPAQIDLQVSAGYNGFFRRGQWTPVRVNVSNTGGTLDGEVRVRTGDGGSLAETTYRTPLSLSRGARKQVFLYVSVDNFTSSIQVEIVDGGGRVVERASAAIRLVNGADILYGVVTESPYGAVDMTALAPGTGQAYQVNWRLADIPPLGEALAGLDVLLFHDVDTGTLAAEQAEAIAQWTLAGGHLIVSGGDSWQRTTAGLAGLVPAELQGTEVIDTLAPLADYLNGQEALREAQTIVTVAEVEPPARSLVVLADGTPLIVRAPYGEGLVDFLAVDPQSEPLRSWSHTDRLWHALVSSAGQQPSWSNGFVNWSAAREATLTTSNTVLPTFLQLCGFLTLYIVLVGPLNYLVLRKLNRRELAWFTIPALIAVFSVLAYTVGFNLRGSRAIVNRLTVVRVWPDGEQAQVMTLIGIQSPRRTTYDVAVDRGYTLRSLPEVGTGLSVPTIITEGTRYMAEQIPIDAGTVASFAAAGVVQVQPPDSAVTWHLGSEAPRVEGMVTNTTGLALHDAVVLVKGESRYLGTLDPGETRVFDIPIGPQDPGPSTLGYTQTPGNLYSSRPWGYAGSAPGWCFSFSGVPLTIPDVMRGEAFSCAVRGVSDDEQEIRRRYRLLSSLVIDTNLSGGRDMDVYLFGWSTSGVVGIDLGEKPLTEEDTTLFIFQLPTRVVADSPVVDVPPALTTWAIAEAGDPATLLEVTPARFRVSSTTQAAFQFQPMPSARLASVSELDVQFQGYGPVIAEIWDWDREEWTVMPFASDSTELQIRRPQRFLGPENAVTIRVRATDSVSYNEIEYVKVGYRGQLAG